MDLQAQTLPLSVPCACACSRAAHCQHAASRATGGGLQPAAGPARREEPAGMGSSWIRVGMLTHIADPHMQRIAGAARSGLPAPGSQGAATRQSQGRSQSRRGRGRGAKRAGGGCAGGPASCPRPPSSGPADARRRGPPPCGVTVAGSLHLNRHTGLLFRDEFQKGPKILPGI